MLANAAKFLVLSSLPCVLAAQAPVASAFRQEEQSAAKKLVAAAEEMPAEKYGFKPTPAQLSFGDVVVHLAAGNDYFCSTIGGVPHPTRTKVTSTDAKDVLVARLKETFDFCDQALAQVDDSKLGEELPFFGGRKMTRAALMIVASDDWGDHYSQDAIYMRLNGVLPPTAKKPSP
jgi:uncharacterized damage-inducible protein DinB